MLMVRQKYPTEIVCGRMVRNAILIHSIQCNLYPSDQRVVGGCFASTKDCENCFKICLELILALEVITAL